MRKTITLGVGILSFLVFTMFARYVYVCKIKNNCIQKEVVKTNNRLLSLVLTDGDSVILQGYEQLAFGKGSISPDLTSNNQEFLDRVAEYIKANQNKNLTITGYYRASEKDTSSGMYANLGLARSNVLRQLLMKKGIEANRITLDYSMISDEELTEPAKFDLFEQRPDDYGENGGFVKTAYLFNNMTILDDNFEFDSDIFKPSTAFKVWADSVQTYLKLNTDKSLIIIGHTDNIGTPQYNTDLGLRRAQSAKAYFEGRAVTVPIKTASKGEKTPAATNITEAGRQKNRRVNFIIK